MLLELLFFEKHLPYQYVFGTFIQWFGCSTSISWWEDLWIEKGIAGALAFHGLPNLVLVSE